MKTIGLFGLFCLAAATQTTADVPVLIRVQRTPGIGTASAVPYARSKSGVPVLGMTSLTGLSETWLISDAGISIVEEVFAFVKKNPPEAQRRVDGCGEDGGARQGAAVPCPRLNIQ